jgi:tetratricopeptide (TPR) repeat protein
VTFLSFRGAYGLVPMLMAVGLGLCAVFAAWTGYRLLRRGTVRLQNLHLKREGRLRGPGLVFGALLFPAVLLTAQTGWVNYHRWRGDQLDGRVTVSREDAFTAGFALPEDERAAAEGALGHYARARSVRNGGDGLLETEGLELRMAWLELVDGRPAEAASTLRDYLAHEGWNDDLAVDVGRMLDLAGRAEEKIAWYERALAGHPGFLGVRTALARAVAEEDPARAEALYREGVKQAPDDPRALTLLGSFYLDHQRYADAEPMFREAIRIEPAHAVYHHDLAVALYLSGRPRQALPEMERAAELDPANPYIALHLDEMRKALGARPERE